MSQVNYIPEQIPKPILDEKKFDDIILYTLGSFGPCEREIFINDPDQGINNRMNKNTFHKWAKELKADNHIEVNKENKNSIYKITQLGLDELLRRLKSYQLDFDTLNKIEQKRIQNYIKSIRQFFKKYEVYNTDIKAEFIELANEITHDKLSFFSEEKFNKLLLFLVLNHPKFYPIYTISIEDFKDKYNKPTDTIKKNLTVADIQQFLQKINIEKIYGDKLFQLILDKDGKSLYFRINSKYGDIFQTVMKSKLKNLYNLSSLGIININADWLFSSYDEILNELIEKFKIFDKDLRDPLKNLLDEFYNKLQQDIKKKPIIDTSFIPYYYISNTLESNSIPEYTPKEKEELEKSLADVNLNLEDNPNDTNRLFTKAELLFKLDKYEDAFKIINKTIKLNPIDNSKFLKTKAIILKKMKILNFFGSGITIKGSEGFKILEEFFANVNRRPLKILNKAININKNDNYISLLLQIKAELLDDMGKFNEALEFINKAIELEKKHPLKNKDDLLGYTNYFEVKAKILNHLKRKKDVKNLIEKEFNTGNLSLHEKAKIYALILRDEDSLKIYDKLIEKNPENLIYYKEKADLLSILGREEESNEIFDYLIEKNSKNKSYLFRKFINLRNIGEYDKALTLIDQVYKESPRRKNDRLDDLYYILREKKRYKDALYVLNQLIQTNPGKQPLIRYYYRKSRILSKLRRYEDAIFTLEKLIKEFSLDPTKDIPIYAYKAYLLAKLGYQKRSVQEIENLLKKCPEDLHVSQMYGKILMQFQEYEMAIDKYKEILAKHQDFFRAYIKIAKCYKLLGNNELTLKNLEKAKALLINKSQKAKMTPPHRFYKEILEDLNSRIEEVKKGNNSN